MDYVWNFYAWVGCHVFSVYGDNGAFSVFSNPNDQLIPGIKRVLSLSFFVLSCRFCE
ncbi:hypothetical protein lpg2728 [Legionella pneumophila subsp. pneumophila str. Philadelphia 1]|uniref:Uncharacterized protein n=1 Tax=Legionella pneumophila subsp. pneumophila (strain Philadelphia 1 / ATCC 33152 / DSM 7513) TaxID=272624 RepID=Q5ZRZ2_LEGPH|nr:hypothetical protein lpg2728 [Legionella pneumophila subsp. pneumophila str. Philadelphia 1]AEW52960.1 hypothetical protein lp12_2720 [Legionella pneumophila subsp. pneumophila ATCC 43290]